MKKTAVFIAVAMAVGSIGIVPAFAASGPTAATSEIKTAAAPNAAAMDATDAKIQHVIAKVTDDALTRSDMSRTASLFTDAQEHRISKSSTYSTGYGDEVNARISAVSKLWKEKYGHDFAMTKAHGAMGPTFASIRTVAAANGKMETATVAIKSSTGATEFEVPLVCQGKDDWKIDVPNSLTAQRLRDNLLVELTAVDNRAAYWPANETDAYRMVAHHVLRVVLDKPMPANVQASAKGSSATIAKAAAAKATPASSSGHWWKFWNW